ncbi:MAG: class I SAM-dependent methyltransferase [Anaerolineae bacterium]|nr:class I SAM-dependent methyltransferase [Anaerolineae bacterium]
MTQERIPEPEAVVDPDQIENYIRLSEKLMGYVYQEVVDRATKLAPIAGRVLDVGTGFGMLAMTLAKKKPDVEIIGLDISEQMTEAGQALVEKRGLAKWISFETADAKEMPFPDDYFDAVISYGSLHHWVGPEQVFDEINRVRKPTGIIYVADLRRDQPRLPMWLLYLGLRVRAGRRQAREMVTSVNAAYTPAEIEAMLARTTITKWQPKHTFYGLNIFSAQK